MTTSTGRTTTPRVHWYGPAIPTGASPITGVCAGDQYDTRLDNVATGNGTIEYRRDENRLVQLNYRYASPEYIQATLPSYSTAAQYKGYFAGGDDRQLADRRSLVRGRAYYYDTNTRKAANQMLGVQYNSCCYAIRLGYERKSTAGIATTTAARANTTTPSESISNCAA
jgi:lipopolysaccharide assembly outer membrane protein LptD (OstA)